MPSSPVSVSATITGASSASAPAPSGRPAGGVRRRDAIRADSRRSSVSTAARTQIAARRKPLGRIADLGTAPGQQAGGELPPAEDAAVLAEDRPPGRRGPEVSAGTDFCQRLRSRSRCGGHLGFGQAGGAGDLLRGGPRRDRAAPSAAGASPVTCAQLRRRQGPGGGRPRRRTAARGLPASPETAEGREKARSVRTARSFLSRTDAGFSPSAHWTSARGRPASVRLNRCRHSRDSRTSS